MRCRYHWTGELHLSCRLFEFSIGKTGYNHDRTYAHFRDREWQKWPVTIVTGVYLGCFVGKFGGEYLLRGKRIYFD